MSKASIKTHNKRETTRKVGNKKTSTTGSIYPEFRKLAARLRQLSNHAYNTYEPLIADIIDNKSRDTQKIEHLLDGLLGFCYDDKMLMLFKRLCRHYYYIDPEATAAHVYAYREMWDEKSLNNDKKG